jgi:hypothetical protein
VTTEAVEVVGGQGGLGGEKSWFDLSEKRIKMTYGVRPQKLDSVGLGLGSSPLLDRATFHCLQRIPLKHLTGASHRDYCFES